MTSTGGVVRSNVLEDNEDGFAFSIAVLNKGIGNALGDFLFLFGSSTGVPINKNGWHIKLSKNEIFL